MSRHAHQFRVRYSETDQMGTVYNSRVLEWFEVGRTELSRSMGFPYTRWEERGVLLPLVEAHVQFSARARYDDLLEIVTSIGFEGRAALRFQYEITQAEDRSRVATGYTVHALVAPSGRVVRPPPWVRRLIEGRGPPTS